MWRLRRRWGQPLAGYANHGVIDQSFSQFESMTNDAHNPFCKLAGYVRLLGLICRGGKKLRFPNDESTKHAVVQASRWLIRHVKHGTLNREGREYSISVIAWKAPTLNPELPNQLAGYAITDTLWASYALTLTNPDIAKELRDSLQSLECTGNSLHEVIWQRIDSIGHKPTDNGIVHGKSLGVMRSGDDMIDIRSFTVTADLDFELGHPLLFAEHAACQSLYEYRLGRVESARRRLRNIFKNESMLEDSNTTSDESMRWNQEHGLLIDYVTKSDHVKFSNGETESCRQYTFKLAVLLYACKLLGLEMEFPNELEFMHRQLLGAQLPSGGLAHFYDVDSSNKRILPCPDATGEATAIFVLAETVTR